MLKTFTLEEAQSLLPVLESLLKRAIESKRAVEEVNAELTEIVRRIHLSGGMQVNLGEVSKLRTELESRLQRAREIIAEIDSIGAQVKDLDVGLLDFPCRVDDEIVLLCWRMGESTIEYWHPMDTGFEDRQLLDGRFRRRVNPGNRPN
jgi:hypothetical protein